MVETLLGTQLHEYLLQVLYVQVFHGASRQVLRVTPAKYGDDETTESCHASSVKGVSNVKRGRLHRCVPFRCFSMFLLKATLPQNT